VRNLRRVLPRALIAAVLAQVTAAVLVFYLHGIVLDQQRKETEAILQRLCNQSLTGVLAVFRDSLDKAHREVVQKITSTYILESKKEVDVVSAATVLRAGLEITPHIDRYFLWSDRLPRHQLDQVLFVMRPRDVAEQHVAPASLNDEGGSLVAIDRMGRDVLAIVREVNKTRPWVLVTREIGGRRYDLAWCRLVLPTGAVVLVGYMVDLDKVRESFVANEIGNLPVDILRPGTGATRLALTVQDERGHVVYGRPVPPGTPSATGQIDFRFFPFGRFADEYYLTTTLPPRLWNVTLSGSEAVPVGSSIGRSVSVVALILILAAILSGVASVRQAVALSRLQTEFVTNVTHQLKTPLTILSGALETLERDRLKAPGKIAEYNALVRSQVGRLSRLVDQILMIARADARLAPKAPVDLNTVVAKCVSELSLARDGTPATISLDAAHLPLMLLGDSDAIEHAVTNLLENAVKYGKTGELNKIEVRTTTSDTEVAVIVRDTGTGIEPSELQHILTKFYRGRHVRSGTKGFGLGLAIVQAVVQSHRGRLTVTSRLDAGSEFGIYFPRLREQEASA
jgi:signal transduction histidine kinase